MMNMIYLRKDVVDALYKAEIESSKWADFVNDAVLEKIEREKKDEKSK